MPRRKSATVTPAATISASDLPAIHAAIKALLDAIADGRPYAKFCRALRSALGPVAKYDQSCFYFSEARAVMDLTISELVGQQLCAIAYTNRRLEDCLPGGWYRTKELEAEFPEMFEGIVRDLAEDLEKLSPLVPNANNFKLFCDPTLARQQPKLAKLVELINARDGRPIRQLIRVVSPVKAATLETLFYREKSRGRIVSKPC